METLRAKDIMTREVKTVPETATLREVAELLAAHDISGAPVVDDAGDLVGIISESDLLDDKKRNAAIPRTAVFGFYMVPDELIRKSYEEGMTLPARAVMTRNVVTADEDTAVSELSRQMLERRINRIPILRDNKPVGIVTREDVLRSLRARPADAGTGVS